VISRVIRVIRNRPRALLKYMVNSLSEAMGEGKERVAPGCLSPGASLRVAGVFYRRMDMAPQLLATQVYRRGIL
jgi:hypothetical protein